MVEELAPGMKNKQPMILRNKIHSNEIRFGREHATPPTPLTANRNHQPDEEEEICRSYDLQEAEVAVCYWMLAGSTTTIAAV